MTDLTPAAVTKIALITDLVASYVSNNHVAPGDLHAFIASVHTAVSGGATRALPGTDEDVAVGKMTAAQIRKSITPEALISFIDGKPYRTLERHLTKHGLTPATYSAR